MLLDFHQRVRRERAWRPLNVVGSISQEMLDRYANGKKSFSGKNIKCQSYTTMAEMVLIIITPLFLATRNKSLVRVAN